MIKVGIILLSLGMTGCGALSDNSPDTAPSKHTPEEVERQRKTRALPSTVSCEELPEYYEACSQGSGFISHAQLCQERYRVRIAQCYN